jgi:outer membrane protein OmpA-like peptidoglycan-associated protein
LTDAARRVLDEVAEDYRRVGTGSLTVAGHTDRKGSAAYNMQLSQRYADAVRDYLLSIGVPAGAITVEAHGESRPLIETRDGVREPQNRRVEITYDPGSGW